MEYALLSSISWVSVRSVWDWLLCLSDGVPSGGSPCSTFHPEQNCVPPHFRRKTAVWCSILETCERSVIERAACHDSCGPLKLSTALPSAKNSAFDRSHYINFNMLILCTVIKHEHMTLVILGHSEWFVFVQTPYTWGLDSPVWRFNSWPCANPLIS